MKSRHRLPTGQSHTCRKPSVSRHPAFVCLAEGMECLSDQGAGNMGAFPLWQYLALADECIYGRGRAILMPCLHAAKFGNPSGRTDYRTYCNSA